MQRPVLGTILKDSGKLSQLSLDKALNLQKNNACMLGDVLAHEGLADVLDIYVALAFQSGVQLVDLQQDLPDADLLRWEESGDYLTKRYIPWRWQHRMLVIACCDVSQSMSVWLEKRYGVPVRLVMTTPRDIVKTVKRVFADELTRDARVSLLKESKHRSARLRRLSRVSWLRRVLPAETSTRFAYVLWLALVLMCLGLIAFPLVMRGVVLLFGVIYAVTLGFKLVLMSVGMLLQLRTGTRYLPKRSLLYVPRLADSELPIYSIIVPMYKEAGNVAPLLEALEKLDYPRSKLDIKLVVEHDDFETIADIYKQKPCGMYDIIIVPPSLPRTKPKACNVALTFARGDYVVIYDVEDRPDVMQLRDAIAKFHSCSKEVICLQARLNYYNREENLLTRFFSLEYGTLFDFLLPAMSHLHMPLPLGGTSNHLALYRLRELGAWDPYNVTEDADLGLRLAVEGFVTLLLDSTTMEEAPISVCAWLMQRSRWIKGYMQTWLVYMRHPRMMRRVLGWRGMVGFQLFFAGSSLVYLSAPPLWVAMFVLMVMRFHHPIDIDMILVLSCMVLFGGMVVHWLSAWMVAFVKRWNSVGMACAVIGFPFYWLLHSLASCRALWQLLRNPYFWDKTPHGKSKYSRLT